MTLTENLNRNFIWWNRFQSYLTSHLAVRRRRERDRERLLVADFIAVRLLERPRRLRDLRLVVGAWSSIAGRRPRPPRALGVA